MHKLILPLIALVAVLSLSACATTKKTSSCCSAGDKSCSATAHR